MADRIDRTCDTPTLVDDIAKIMLQDTQKGYERIDQCDLTFAARKALDFYKPGVDTQDSVVQRTLLFYHTAKRDLTEQVEDRALEIHREKFKNFLDQILK